jgi:hypothetical protein
VIDGFANRVDEDAQLVSDFASRSTTAEPLLGLCQDLVREHVTPASLARLIEAFGSFFAKLLGVPFDAVAGNAEGTNDVHLLASILADKLRGEHAKRCCFMFRMLKDRVDATEVRPRAVLSDDTNSVIDPGSTIGQQR